MCRYTGRLPLKGRAFGAYRKQQVDTMIKLNPDKEVVNRIKEGLKKKG